MRNRGELAEGWYDPDTKRKADESARRPDTHQEGHTSDYSNPPELEDREGREDSEDDTFGPPLPGELDRRIAAGPAIPSMQDLALRRGKYILCIPPYIRLQLTNVNRNGC